jgi:anti-sigma regulatory factor (Ser/Thr protein kinase)
MQKKFARSYESLKEIYDFTEALLESAQVAQSVRYPVHFAMEELFTNMVKYNPENNQDISLDVETDSSNVTVTMVDYDVDAFDVSRERPVDTESPLEKRPVGGLGLHLIRHMVDTLNYQYADRQSRITFTKRLA